MSLDETLAAIDALLAEQATGGPAGFTAEELAKVLGVCHRAACDKIAGWIDAGAVEFAGRAERQNRVGTKCRKPVYRVVREAKC